MALLFCVIEILEKFLLLETRISMLMTRMIVRMLWNDDSHVGQVRPIDRLKD